MSAKRARWSESLIASVRTAVAAQPRQDVIDREHRDGQRDARRRAMVSAA
jgi:hypothetical protein